MYIDIKKIQVNDKLFKPTKNVNTNYEKGETGFISPELLTILIHLKGGRIVFNDYAYFSINSNDFVIVLREKI